MFQSATVKLTLWYLLIIMVISLLFSGLVYQSATSELDARIQQFGSRLPEDLPLISGGVIQIQNNQIKVARHNILYNLFYINILILAAGGFASFLMARRTLKPLEEAHAAESRFVSDASHELRTPLAVMRAELELAIRTKQLTDEETKAVLKSSLEEVDRLTRLSQTLLSLSRQDYASLPHKKVAFDTIVRSVVETYDRTQRIDIQLPKKPLLILAHQPSIEELITILVDNALKYSPPEGKIKLILHRKNNKAVFTITNRGKGISAKVLPHIFDRFYRSDNSRTSSDKAGFGLGLSIAKVIVEHHRGELDVTSAPDANTTFTIRLPQFRSTRVVQPELPNMLSKRQAKNTTK